MTEPAKVVDAEHLLLTKVQLLDNDGLASITGVLDHPGHGVADESLSLMSALAIGHQRYPPSVQAVSRGIGLGDRQMIGVQIDADCTTPSVRDNRHAHHIGAHEHPPSPAIPLEAVADGLPQFCGTRRLFTMLPPIPSVLSIALQRSQYLLMPIGKPDILDQQVFPMLLCQGIGHPDPEVEAPVLSYRGDA